MLAKQNAIAEGFTIGICASDSAGQLPDLLSLAKSEDYGPGFVLKKVVVMASACPKSIIAKAREVVGSDSKFELLAEPERRGKATAINGIIERSTGEYLVMLNADAFPDPGSIRELLSAVASNPRVGCVSARPIPEDGEGLLKRSLRLMWSAHSMMSINLNHAGISNHACDELITVRRALVRKLPQNLINDGAYIGGLLAAQGYRVNFSTSASVRIDVPDRFTDLIRQRRRIIFGHIQVWRKLGHPPKTIESMLFIDPLVSLRTVVRLLSAHPRLIMALPVVVAAELISGFMAGLDTIRSTDRHTVWRRIVR